MKAIYARKECGIREHIDTCNLCSGHGTANVETLGRVDINKFLRGLVHHFESENGTDHDRSRGSTR